MISEDELFFGFPNVNSAPGFTKFGWHRLGALTAFIRPVSIGFSSRAVQRVERFDERHDRLAKSIVPAGAIMVERSADYLNWRYLSPSRQLYTAFNYESDGDVKGYCVARLLRIRGLNVCIVMEAFGTTPQVERRLLSSVAKWASRNGHA